MPRLPGALTAETHSLSLNGIEDPASIAATVWDLPTIAEGHLGLLAAAERAGSSPGETVPALVAEALVLAHLFCLAHQDDPLLSPALLPQD